MNVRIKLEKKLSTPKFRSKFEKTVADYLTKKSIKFEYESIKTKFYKHVQGGYCGDCASTDIFKRSVYLPDFSLRSSKPIYLETKGRFTSSDRTKILAVLNTSKEINRNNFRLLFMRDNYTTKVARERYTEWCNRHNIQCAVWPIIPKGFFK